MRHNINKVAYVAKFMLLGFSSIMRLSFINENEYEILVFFYTDNGFVFNAKLNKSFQWERSLLVAWRG